MGSGPVWLDYAGRVFLLPFPFGETKSEITLLSATFIRNIKISREFLARNSVFGGEALRTSTWVLHPLPSGKEEAQGREIHKRQKGQTWPHVFLFLIYLAWLPHSGNTKTLLGILSLPFTFCLSPGCALSLLKRNKLKRNKLNSKWFLSGFWHAV